jgi:hypothetical protein
MEREEVERLQEEAERLTEENRKLEQAVNDLSDLRDDLARIVANKFARDVIREASKDPEALLTSYGDVKEWLPVYFRNQGQEWLALLVREFESETVIEAAQVPELRTWKPRTSGVDPEEIIAESEPIKILFLAANPTDTTRLRLDKEMRAIDEALRQAEFRDRFDIKQHWAVRAADLQALLLRHKPHIVHFSGHGGRSSRIILEDKSGRSRAVSPRALAKLFSVLKDNIRCVVLNACYSERQGQAIAQHIDCVIGMAKAIGDAAAISFAASFYQALGFGRDLKTAFDLGCVQIGLENLDEQDTPELLCERVDPQKIVLVDSG